jgi:hypothetical protein
MPYIIQCKGFADGRRSSIDKQFMVSFDHDYANFEDGMLRLGDGKFSPDMDEAKRFPDAESALDFWRKQSTKHPLRPDGKPNRPMTGMNVAPIWVPDRKEDRHEANARNGDAG